MGVADSSPLPALAGTLIYFAYPDLLLDNLRFVDLMLNQIGLTVSVSPRNRRHEAIAAPRHRLNKLRPRWRSRPAPSGAAKRFA